MGEKTYISHDLSRMPPGEVRDLLKHLTPEERKELYALIASIPPGYAEFVSKTQKHELDSWQVYLCNRLERLRYEKGQRLLVHACPQIGKPVSVDEPVLMFDGSYKRLGDIEVGDYVIGKSGSPCLVEQIHEQGLLECVQIATKSGRTAIAEPSHPFLTPDGWIEAGNLKIGQGLSLIPLPECESRTERKDDEFELCGYLVGDGCVVQGTCNITSNDPVQTERILSVVERLGFNANLYKKKGTAAKTIGLSGGVRPWTRDIGIAGKNSYTKRVPDWVFQGTKHQIGLFIGAYFSCDGTVHLKGKARDGSERTDCAIEFFSVSAELLGDVQKLLLRLGIASTIRKKLGTYNRAEHVSYRLTLNTRDDVSEFARWVDLYGAKAQKLATVNLMRMSHRQVYLSDPVVSVTPVGKHACRCLSVANDHSFTANDFVVHNSLVLTQRLPAYLIGCNPASRSGIASFNQTKSVDFAKINLSILRTAEFAQMFPNPLCKLTTAGVKQDSFSTVGREAYADAQPSLVALGMESGFIGRGFGDGGVLIIDDPYPSAQDAFSPRINEIVRQWWGQTVEPRISDDTNVVVVFHRYHDQDFAQYLIDQGGWEFIRLAAIADGDLDYPDPLGRAPGELLSPRLSPAKLQKILDDDPLLFYGQFQGLPRPATGGFFQADWLADSNESSPFIDELPEIDVWVRAYDLATSAKTSADHTAGALVGINSDGTVILADMIRQKTEWADTEKTILESSAKDNSQFGRKVHVVIESDGLGLMAYQQLSKDAQFLSTPLYRLDNRGQGDKKQRAAAWQAKVAGGKFKMLRGAWNQAFIKECLGFTGRIGGRDDQVDAVSNAVNYLSMFKAGHREPEKPIPNNTWAYYDKLAEINSANENYEWSD